MESGVFCGWQLTSGMDRLGYSCRVHWAGLQLQGSLGWTTVAGFTRLGYSCRVHCPCHQAFATTLLQTQPARGNVKLHEKTAEFGGCAGLVIVKGSRTFLRIAV